MTNRRFLHELRRRHVFRVAAAYAIVAWLLIQIATQVFPFFHIPEWSVRLLVLLLLAGFPIALLLAWAFDATPQGIVRTGDADGASPRRSRRAGIAVGLIGMLIAAFAGGGYWWWHRPLAAPLGSTTASTPAPPGATVASSIAIPAKSIAVLPFENLSEDKANAYFADGIQDEILTRLSRISALKVISRTSTQQYASKPGNLSEIARQLGVANILEGSVQKAGDSVRINVQLIRADGDSHLWAETYDRKLTDIFGVESEVATAIAGSLQATLTGREQRALAVKPTDNVAAYDAYLRGLVLAAGGFSDDDNRRAAAAYAEAVRLDPNFALAWAYLTESRSYLYFSGIDTAENTLGAIKQAADTALRLQPESGEAWLAQGYYRYRGLRDYPGALQAFDEARKRLPNNTLVLAAFALVQRRMGRWQEGLSNMQQAVQLDPRNLSALGVLGQEFLMPMRRFAEARVVADRALLIAPGDASFIALKAEGYLAEGRFEEAAKLADPLPLDPKVEAVLPAKFGSLLAQGLFETAIAELQTALPKSGEPLTIKQTLVALDLGYTQLRVGQAAAARSTFDRVIRTLKPMRAAAVRVDETGLTMALASAYAGIGDKQAALDQAHKAVELYRDDTVQTPQAEATLAQVQAWVGEKDAAMAALPHLLQVPNGVMPGELLWDPRWDPLRSDPRFQALLKDGAGGSNAAAYPSPAALRVLTSPTRGEVKVFLARPLDGRIGEGLG